MSASFTRRRLLKQSFAFSAALALGMRARLTAADESLTSGNQLFMIGDWGANGDIKAQTAVASGMGRYIADHKLKPDALLLLGDNFYGPFKGGVTCPRWKTQFDDMYPASTFPGSCYAMLGNHDYDEEVGVKMEAQLAYAKATPGTRWTMPSKWYSFDYSDANKQPLVKFIALDSNYHNRVRSLTAEEKAEQLSWFKTELAKPRTAPWLVVMAHHPVYTNGGHGDDKALIKDWEPLFREHKVDFYFAGHDHDLQHIEFEGHPTSFVLSGGGGARITEIKEMKHGPYAQGIYGFSQLQITADKFLIRHLDANRNQVHAFTKTTAGKVTVLT
jgi:tartrate-resistant acid phosphatase type 5